MHILFLTDNFPPEVNAPASRTFEHCREWVKAGHKVTVMTCAPNFPKGKVYPGYKNKFWQSQQIDGIRVIRVLSYITANEGFLRRTLDYISFMISAVLMAPFVRKVDLVIGTSPQFFTACAAYVVSRYKRIPFIFELRDLWPESIKAVGAMKDGFLLRLLERIELFLYRKAARIITVTNSFKEILTARGIDPLKIEVITNGVDLARFKPGERDKALAAKHGLENKFVAGYIGTHGMAHALQTLLLGAEKLQQHAKADRIRFLFLGDGARKPALIKQAQDMGLKNVIFLDSVPKEEVVRYWTLLDLSIIHLRKTDLFKTVIPSKLFESMGMNIPILHGVQGESARIIKHNGVGITFEPENVDEFVAAVLRLESDRELYQSFVAACATSAPNYARRTMALNMLAILEAAQKPAHADKSKNDKLAKL